MISSQAEDVNIENDAEDAPIDETLASDHLMDHFATWYLITVISIDLIQLFLQQYRETHSTED